MIKQPQAGRPVWVSHKPRRLESGLDRSDRLTVSQAWRGRGTHSGSAHGLQVTEGTEPPSGKCKRSIRAILGLQKRSERNRIAFGAWVLPEAALSILSSTSIVAKPVERKCKARAFLRYQEDEGQRAVRNAARKSPAGHGGPAHILSAMPRGHFRANGLKATGHSARRCPGRLCRV